MLSGTEYKNTDEVFGVARDIPLNYVTRPDVDDVLNRSLKMKKHLVIFGSSKQGKTSLRKYNMAEGSYSWITCSNRWDLGELHAAILKAVGFEISQSSTISQGKHHKIQASIKGQLGTQNSKIGVDIAAETGDNTEAETEKIKLELDPDDVNEVIGALNEAKAKKFLVLEDFHYLPDETQNDFAVALKAFHESSDYTFVVVGVWKDENKLIQANGDLSGRVISINADKWSTEKLSEVIKGGEERLNIRFAPNFKSSLLEGCFGSVYVVQEACRVVCEEKGIWRTQEENVEVDADAQRIIKQVVNANSARYRGFIESFASGFQSSALEMYRWLLLPILTADVETLDKGLAMRDIKMMLDRYHPKGPLNAGNLTQALKSTVSLQIHTNLKPVIIDYDESIRRLNVVDQSFLIWLQHQDRYDLLECAGLTEFLDQEQIQDLT